MNIFTKIIPRAKNKINQIIYRFQNREARSSSLAVSRIRRDPTDPINWVDLITIHFNALPKESQEIIIAHNLKRNGLIGQYKSEIQQRAGSWLNAAAARIDKEPMETICADVAEEFVRLKTIIQCRDAHSDGNYYRDAEPYMQKQWDQVIWPIIKDLDFSSVLEIAPGHGRNTEQLRQHAQSITLVDVNRNCIDACQRRFGEITDGCTFKYFVTNGNSLGDIADTSISLVYTFDSMVHFDKSVVRDYVKEIRRVLKPNGSAFLHHSNYGSIAPNSDWAHNPGNRSDMTAGLMRKFADEVGLLVDFQRLSGIADGWGMEDLDAFTVLRKAST